VVAYALLFICTVIRQCLCLWSTNCAFQVGGKRTQTGRKTS